MDSSLTAGIAVPLQYRPGTLLSMHFPVRMIQLCKAATYTQQTLTEAAELYVNQIRRYEAGTGRHNPP
jgi:hypothetical protein